LSTDHKILVFAHDASLYGASQSLLTLLEGITENRFAELLVLLPHKGKIEDVFILKGINYKVIDFPRCFTWNHSKSFFQKLNNIIGYNRKVRSILPHLVNIVDQYKPDMIYSNTSIISIGAVLAKKMRLPHVWHIREFGDLDYNFEYLPTRKYVIKQMRNSAHTIFVSKSLQEHWLGLNTSSSSVIYNGLVNASILYPAKSFPVNGFRFGILGALVPGKGQDIAIKAIASLSKKYPSVSLYLYGNIVDKDYYKMLTQLISELNCGKNVVFVNFEENQDLIYSNLDVLLNCSVMEGFGRTIIEAMSRDIPVIANASGGPLEIICDKKNGLLFNHTAESLITCMETLMNNEKLYNEVSKNGKQESLNYSITSYVSNVCNVFKNILAKN
jgi:glycosyltransferase involved in cell wall biosynthesis